ncbi:unnamed protein product [Lota lota]
MASAGQRLFLLVDNGVNPQPQGSTKRRSLVDPQPQGSTKRRSPVDPQVSGRSFTSPRCMGFSRVELGALFSSERFPPETAPPVGAPVGPQVAVAVQLTRRRRAGLK